MRYLLDEVSKYEHGFHDMLMPSRSYERHVTFMGAVMPSREHSPNISGATKLLPSDDALCLALTEMSPEKIRPQIRRLFTENAATGSFLC
jgi:hypothetical protein